MRLIGKINLTAGKVGKNAYEVSNVWRLGVHAFKTEHDYILRLCYFRWRSTHYIQISKSREVLNSCG